MSPWWLLLLVPSMLAFMALMIGAALMGMVLILNPGATCALLDSLLRKAAGS